MLPRSEEIKDLALKFSKQQLSGLAKRGEIDPMTAVMAGMMRDRIVSEEMRQSMPETTVADDVLGAAQQMGQPQGVGQPQDQFAQMNQPVEGQPQMAMMAEGGLASIPFDDGMFDYAGGGIVAFSNGGDVKRRFESLPRYVGEEAGIPGAELTSFFKSQMRGDVRVDPVTGRPVTFGEFIRLEDQRAAAAARTPAIQAITPGVAASSQPQISVNQPTSFLGGLLNTAAPSISGTSQPSTAPSIAPIDDSAEMARLARQAQGAGVPMAPRIQQPPPPPEPRPGSGLQPAPVSASAVSGASTDLMNRLNKAYGVGADGALATLPTGIEDIFKEREEAERRAGVDKDFFKNEARNILDLRRDLKADKKDAANMRLIEAGLRIMGGDSPYAFVNIGKGASEALKGFADDIKDIQKTKREYDKSERELRTAEQLYARTQSDSALKTVEERRTRNQEQQIRFAEAQNNLQLKLSELDVRRQQVDVQREGIAVQRQQVAQGASSPIERIADRLRRANPNLTYEQAIQRAFGMQQEPRTRAALEKEFLDNPILVRQYGTYENYLKATSGGGTNYRERYGLE